MWERNDHSEKETANIPCIEVLVSANLNAIAPAVHWTLSVYSLENRPVTTDESRHSDIFHFMVFDWQRTIKELLEHSQVRYSVLRYFKTESIFDEPPLPAAAEEDEVLAAEPTS